MDNINARTSSVSARYQLSAHTAAITARMQTMHGKSNYSVIANTLPVRCPTAVVFRRVQRKVNNSGIALALAILYLTGLFLIANVAFLALREQRATSRGDCVQGEAMPGRLLACPDSFAGNQGVAVSNCSFTSLS